MKVLIQRVREAKVRIEERTIGSIGKGLLVFLGVRRGDTEEDADYLVSKVLNLRIFEDPDGKLNLSLAETGAELLVVSQFTLYGDCRKGRRPSFTEVAGPQHASRLYSYFIERAVQEGIRVQSGKFQARMEVELINDGPVTLIIESRKGS